MGLLTGSSPVGTGWKQVVVNGIVPSWLTSMGPAGGAMVLSDRRGRPLYKSGEILLRFRPETEAGRIERLHARIGSSAT